MPVCSAGMAHMLNFETLQDVRQRNRPTSPRGALNHVKTMCNKGPWNRSRPLRHGYYLAERSGKGPQRGQTALPSVAFFGALPPHFRHLLPLFGIREMRAGYRWSCARFVVKVCGSASNSGLVESGRYEEAHLTFSSGLVGFRAFPWLCSRPDSRVIRFLVLQECTTTVVTRLSRAQPLSFDISGDSLRYCHAAVGYENGGGCAPKLASSDGNGLQAQGQMPWKGM